MVPGDAPKGDPESSRTHKNQGQWASKPFHKCTGMVVSFSTIAASSLLQRLVTVFH